MVQEMNRTESLWAAGPVNSIFGLLTGDSTWEDVESALTRYGTKIDALEAFTTRFGRPVRSVLSSMESIDEALGPISVIGDAMTIVSPGDKGVLGWVDRGMAGAGIGGAIIAANSLDEVPGVGEVIMAGTGAYFWVRRSTSTGRRSNTRRRAPLMWSPTPAPMWPRTWGTPRSLLGRS